MSSTKIQFLGPQKSFSALRLPKPASVFNPSRSVEIAREDLAAIMANLREVSSPTPGQSRLVLAPELMGKRVQVASETVSSGRRQRTSCSISHAKFILNDKMQTLDDVGALGISKKVDQIAIGPIDPLPFAIDQEVFTARHVFPHVRANRRLNRLQNLLEIAREFPDDGNHFRVGELVLYEKVDNLLAAGGLVYLASIPRSPRAELVTRALFRRPLQEQSPAGFELLTYLAQREGYVQHTVVCPSQNPIQPRNERDLCASAIELRLLNLFTGHSQVNLRRWLSNQSSSSPYRKDFLGQYIQERASLKVQLALVAYEEILQSTTPEKSTLDSQIDHALAFFSAVDIGLREGMLGMGDLLNSEWLESLHPSTRKNVESKLQGVQDALREQKKHLVEYICLAKPMEKFTRPANLEVVPSLRKPQTGRGKETDTRNPEDEKIIPHPATRYMTPSLLPDDWQPSSGPTAEIIPFAEPREA